MDKVFEDRQKNFSEEISFKSLGKLASSPYSKFELICFFFFQVTSIVASVSDKIWTDFNYPWQSVLNYKVVAVNSQGEGAGNVLTWDASACQGNFFLYPCVS